MEKTTINSRIKAELTRGDVQKMADMLGMSHQNVAHHLKGEKEIDSIRFVEAACQVTGKPFDYFYKPSYDLMDNPLIRMEMQQVREDALFDAYKRLEDKVESLSKKIKELEKHSH